MRLTDKQKKIARRTYWANKFTKKIVSIHKQYTKAMVAKILGRIDRAVTQIAIRSKKCGVLFNLTLEQLRRLTYNSYGNKCLFCNKILTIHNFVYDHIIPISAMGESSIKNLQLICKSCNTKKGSLRQEDFITLLKWLDTMPEDFKRNILTRLAGGRG